MKTRVRKIARGTYRVTFTKTQSFTVVVPNLWIEMGTSELELKKIAIEAASELLPTV